MLADISALTATSTDIVLLSPLWLSLSLTLERTELKDKTPANPLSASPIDSNSIQQTPIQQTG